jgi:hypothetical protein
MGKRGGKRKKYPTPADDIILIKNPAPMVNPPSAGGSHSGEY